MRTLYFILFLVSLLLFTACEELDYNYGSDRENSTGTGGSLARFTISGDYLYTVDSEKLKTFSLSDEQNPEFLDEVYVSFGVETIFAAGEFLFLGSTQGIYIYSLTEPSSPQYVSAIYHVLSCDPVIVNGNFAYSTLNSDGPCGQSVNQLDIINIENPSNPYLINTVNMESPKGLGISGSLLFVCDNGLKIFGLTDPASPQFLRKIEDIDPVDVIPLDTLLLVATENGMAEYSIDDDQHIQLLSTLYSIN